MLSLGPFPWESIDIPFGFSPVICLSDQAARWYWLHRRWTLSMNIFHTPSGTTVGSGSAVIEWNIRTMDNISGPPTAKEQLPAGYQMEDLSPLGFGSPVLVNFFSRQLGSTFSKSGVFYEPDLSFVRPGLLIAVFGTALTVTTGNQDGAVAGSIDGAFLPIGAPFCTGYLTMNPLDDWVYP